jgi:hypothetical protein
MTCFLTRNLIFSEFNKEIEKYEKRHHLRRGRHKKSLDRDTELAKNPSKASIHMQIKGESTRMVLYQNLVSCCHFLVRMADARTKPSTKARHPNLTNHLVSLAFTFQKLVSEVD